MQEIFTLLFIGFAAGAGSGILGIGGGIIIVPLLVSLLGYSQKLAQGTSIGLLVLPLGILAVLNYHRAGFLNFRAVAIMAAMFVLGSYLSSLYAVGLPDVVLRKIFGVFLILYSFKLLASN